MAEKEEFVGTETSINIPEEYLLRIARITTAWGTLEAMVDFALWKLGGFENGDARATIFTAHMTWPLKMDVLESLANFLSYNYPHLSKFALIKPMLTEAQTGRNSVSHGAWSYEGGKVVRLRATARGKLKASVSPISTEELDNILLAIRRATRGVSDVVLDTGKLPGAIIPEDPA